MSEYTVVGLTVSDSGELLVAGVYEGDLTSVDEDNSTAGYERWAGTVEAEDPADAENRAVLLHQLGALPQYVCTSQLESGDSIVYAADATDEVAEVWVSGDTVVVEFVDGDEAVFDGSALVYAVRGE